MTCIFSRDACVCLERSLGRNFDAMSRLLKLGSSLPVLECNPTCKCSLYKCSNRVVQLGPLNGLRIAATPGKGSGLFAGAAISRGAFVCEYAGEVIGPSEAEARSRSSRSSANYILHVNESYSGGRRQQIIVDPVRTRDYLQRARKRTVNLAKQGPGRKVARVGRNFSQPCTSLFRGLY